MFERKVRIPKVILLAALLSLLLLLSGCAGKEPPAEKEEGLLLGFAQIGSESSWRIGNTRSVQEAAQRHGIRLMMADANQKQENEIRSLRSFIAYRVDVLAFVPIVEDGWENVLREAKQAGIPIILSDRQISPDIDEELYDAYVGADFLAEGRRAGEYLLRKIEDMGAERLRIVELSGTPDSTPALERARGFRDALEGDGRFQILETVSGDFLRSKGKECMRQLLSGWKGQVDVLYSHNDGMTLGAIEAIEEAGLQPGKDIVIITVDGEQAAIDLLREGKINCVVECTPMLGEAVMDLAERLKAGETVPRNTYPEETMFTEYDDLDAIAPRGY